MPHCYCRVTSTFCVDAGTHSYPLGENHSNVQLRFHLSVLLTSFLSWQPFVFVELRQFSLLTGPSRIHFIIFSYSPLSTSPLVTPPVVTVTRANFTKVLKTKAQNEVRIYDWLR